MTKNTDPKHYSRLFLAQNKKFTEAYLPMLTVRFTELMWSLQLQHSYILQYYYI